MKPWEQDPCHLVPTVWHLLCLSCHLCGVGMRVPPALFFHGPQWLGGQGDSVVQRNTGCLEGPGPGSAAGLAWCCRPGPLRALSGLGPSVVPPGPEM